MGTQKSMAAKPKHKSKKGRVRAQRRNFRVKWWEEKRGKGDAGVGGGQGAEQKQNNKGGAEVKEPLGFQIQDQAKKT